MFLESVWYGQFYSVRDVSNWLNAFFSMLLVIVFLTNKANAPYRGSRSGIQWNHSFDLYSKEVSLSIRHHMIRSILFTKSKQGTHCTKY